MSPLLSTQHIPSRAEQGFPSQRHIEFNAYAFYVSMSESEPDLPRCQWFESTRTPGIAPTPPTPVAEVRRQGGPTMKLSPRACAMPWRTPWRDTPATPSQTHPNPNLPAGRGLPMGLFSLLVARTPAGWRVEGSEVPQAGPDYHAAPIFRG